MPTTGDKKFGVLISIINRTPTTLSDGAIRAHEDVIDSIKAQFCAFMKLLEE